MIHIGTAGWSIARDAADAFPSEGTALQRYAARFPVAEINSSFHRAHRLSTWRRWRDDTPDAFRFAVKLPKTITHERKLVNTAELLDPFVEQVAQLGDKLGVLLVQLPPKLAFDPDLASAFFAGLSGRTSTAIACEPRHESWFTPAANGLLVRCRVARVAADPARCPGADLPGGWRGFAYWRLHGSPVTYRSSYADRILHYAQALAHETMDGRDAWFIFDNTASSAATGDALELIGALV